MITEYGVIIIEFPLGYVMELEAIFHHEILDDEDGWFNMFLN